MDSEAFNQWYQQLAYLHGQPLATAIFRQEPEHFQVIEQLTPPSTDGEGEHQWLWVRKKGANTVFVAEQLAAFAGVSPRQVSYAGLKDRHAETWQWFSVQLPGQALLAWEELHHAEFAVERAVLQPKKLRLGFHDGNRFRIRLTDVENMEALLERWQRVVESGFPNYFGEQRFGRDGANIAKAKRWFEAGRKYRVNRNQQSFLLSSVRSLLFNQVTSARVSAQRLLPEVGDVLGLAGNRSVFRVEQVDAELLNRMASGDVHLTGPLVGDEKQLNDSEIAQFEHSCCDEFWVQGLRQQRVEASRRPLLAFPRDAQHQQIDANTLVVEFSLDAGAFATSLLREIVQLTNAKANPDAAVELSDD